MARSTAGYVVALLLAACGGTISSQPDGGDGGRSSGSGSGIAGSSNGSSGGVSGSNSGVSSGSGSGASSSGVGGSSSGGFDCSGSGSGAGVSCCWQHGGSSTAQHQQCVWGCCQQVDPANGKAFLELTQKCACGNGGPCGTECANEFCANGTFTSYGDGCGDCIQKALAGPCSNVLSQCCPNDAYYNECVSGCP